jgi:hypothetical protein
LFVFCVPDGNGNLCLLLSKESYSDRDKRQNLVKEVPDQSEPHRKIAIRLVGDEKNHYQLALN